MEDKSISIFLNFEIEGGSKIEDSQGERGTQKEKNSEPLELNNSEHLVTSLKATCAIQSNFDFFLLCEYLVLHNV